MTVQSFNIFLAVMAAVAVAVFSYIRLPQIDFTQYTVGTDLSEHTDSEVPEYETVFTYEKDGRECEFSLENLPDSTWTFVDQRSKLIKKGYVAIESDDNATAIRCFKAAMDQGSLEGKVHVARCYETGRGVSKDEPHAFKLYRDAAMAGYMPVLSNLGNCYINGIGTPKDEAEGYATFMKGAEAGDAICMANVANCLMQGVGVEKNEEEGKTALARGRSQDFRVTRLPGGRTL